MRKIAFKSTAFSALKMRAIEITLHLLENRDTITTRELATRYGLGVRSIRYDLNDISHACESLGIRLLHSRTGVRLDCNEEQESQLRQQLIQAKSNSDPNSRMKRLLSVLLTEDQPIVVKQLQDILDASPRTIYTDMDRAESWLGEFGINLIRKPHYGAKVEGSELVLRVACFSLLAEGNPLDDFSLKQGTKKIMKILEERTDPFVLRALINEEDLEKMIQILLSYEGDLQIPISWIVFLIYMVIMTKRMRMGKSVSLKKKNLRYLQETEEYSIASTLALKLTNAFHLDFPEEEIAFVTLYLLGAYTPTRLNMQENFNFKSNQFVIELVKKMIIKVETSLGIGDLFSHDDDLFNGLVLHVKPMVYRLMNDIPIQNQLLNDIKSEHPLAYYASVVAGQFLEGWLGKSVSTAEIGYIALHFGAAIERQQARPKIDERQVKVVVVCAGGIGTGKILQSRLQTTMDNFDVIRTLDMTQVKAINSVEADLIISTVPIDQAPLQHIVVNPLLPDNDRKRLNHWVFEQLGINGVSPVILSLKESIKDLILQHFHVHNFDAVEDKIEQLLLQLTPNVTVRENLSRDRKSDLDVSDKKDGYRLDHLLSKECIQVNCNANEREEVVDIVGDMLVNAGAVEKHYVDAMKTSLMENGPYMVIVPGVAILHARPQDGVRHVCMSMATLSHGVEFGHKDNDPVDVVFAFGAVDDHQHLQALRDLMELLSDEDSMNSLRNAVSVQEVLEVVQNTLA